MIKECKHCGCEFNIKSQAKKEAGGYINECPDCVEDRGGDNTPVIRGFVGGAEASAPLHILKFKNNKDAEAYSKAWNTKPAWNNAKQSVSDVKFEKISES